MEVSDERWPHRVITSTRSACDLRQFVLLLAVSAPLWWLPGGFSRFVVAKLLVTAVAVVAAALAPPVGALPRPVVLVGVAWAACFALAALLGDTPWASLVGRWPRYEGLPTLGLYASACWTGARVVGRGAGSARRLDVAAGAMALLLAAFSVLDVLGVTPLGPSTDERSGSVLGNATDQGAVAMMAALLLAGPALRRPDGAGLSSVVFLRVSLAAGLATVAISGSRAALGLTLIGLLVAAAAQDRGGAARVRLRVTPAGCGAVVLLVVTALLVPTTRDRLLGLGTAEGRLHQWRLTLDLVLENPVLGLGGSRYVDAFLRVEDAAFVDFTGTQRLADSPHSILLQVLVAGGVLLLGVTVVGAYVVARTARAALADHPEAGPAALAVVAYLALACVNFTTAGPTCLAALLLGTVIAVPVRVGARDRSRVPIAATSGLLALVLAAAAIGDVALRRGVEAADVLSGSSADAHFGRAVFWRPWDVDVPVIAARSLSGAAAAGEVAAAPLAERRARDAVEVLPTGYESLVALGVSLSAQGQVGEAAAALDRAVALAPQRLDGYVQRAIARVGLGRVDEAVADLHRAQEIAPRSPVVRRLLRRVEREAGG